MKGSQCVLLTGFYSQYVGTQFCGELEIATPHSQPQESLLHLVRCGTFGVPHCGEEMMNLTLCS